MSAPVAGENPDYSGTDIPPLLNSTDYATFSGLSQDWFISAAGVTVRNFLGWHVAPNVTETLYCDMTGDGTIFLPSRYVTAVASVTPPWPGAPAVASGAYYFDQRGWITLLPMSYGYAPSPATGMLWPIDTVRLFDAYPKNNRRMIVEFSHGYENLPFPVAEVAYELVMRAMEKPAGVATDVTAGPYQYKFQEFGMVLSDDQKNRLASYKIPSVR
jgi:hypothetical protein